MNILKYVFISFLFIISSNAHALDEIVHFTRLSNQSNKFCPKTIDIKAVIRYNIPPSSASLLYVDNEYLNIRTKCMFQYCGFSIDLKRKINSINVKIASISIVKKGGLGQTSLTLLNEDAPPFAQSCIYN